MLIYVVRFVRNATTLTYRVATDEGEEAAVALAASELAASTRVRRPAAIFVVSIDSVDPRRDGDGTGVLGEPTESPQEALYPPRTKAIERFTVQLQGKEHRSVFRSVTEDPLMAIAMATFAFHRTHGEAAQRATITQVEHFFTIANDDLVDYWRLA